jgi:hypothetical protein
MFNSTSRDVTEGMVVSDRAGRYHASPLMVAHYLFTFW